tara:strand:+ start:8611 stop:9018 length:408 start_codon:yes stop_codon:yes gene_type:complete
MIHWSKLEYFKKEEFNHPEQMDSIHLVKIDILRANIGESIKITSDFREGDDGYHGKGLATDLQCPKIGLYEFYQQAERHNFNGIGIYPHWNTPGIHVDSRPLIGGMGARWICIKVDGKQKYIALNEDNLKKYILN